MKVLFCPPVMRLRMLAKFLKMTPANTAKLLPNVRKAGGRIECTLGGQQHYFLNLSQVVVPFNEAKEILLKKKHSKIHVHLLSIEQIICNNMLEEREVPPQTPVIVLLGHFDHGKTTLLDALGSPHQPQTIEACGITQNVRTRGVDLQRWKTILPSTISCSSTSVSEVNDIKDSNKEDPWYSTATFVDTPGQELFYRLRSNGALCGDMIVLVVDCSQGVGSQTEESIGCAEELGLPVVVALNKSDLVSSEVLQEVEASLREYTILDNAAMFPVSAKLRTGITELVDGVVEQLHANAAVQLCSVKPHNQIEANSGGGRTKKRLPIFQGQTDNKELLAKISHDKARAAQWWRSVGKGVVLDAMLRKGQGAALHVLLQKGELSIGDVFVAGLSRFKVRQILKPEEGDDYRSMFIHQDDEEGGNLKFIESSPENKTETSQNELISRAAKQDKISLRKKQQNKKTLSTTIDNDEIYDHSSNLRRGEAAQLLVTVLPPLAGSNLNLIGPVQTGKRTTKPLSSGGGGGGKKSFQYSPVGEEFVILNPEQAQLLQDLRHCDADLATAEKAGQGLIQRRSELEEEDDEHDDEEDEEDDSDDDEYDSGRDDKEKDEISSTRSVKTLNSQTSHEKNTDMMEVKRRFVVIKTASASSLDTILDAIRETQESRIQQQHTEDKTSFKYDMIEVVSGNVGPVTMSDVNISISAGVDSILTYGVPNHIKKNNTIHSNITQKQSNKKNKNNVQTFKNLDLFARYHSINILHFDTIQELIDEAFCPSSQYKK